MQFYKTWPILAVGLTAGAFNTGQSVAAPSSTEIRDRVRAYREQHELAIVGEFAQLLAIPNHAADTANIRKNADVIAKALRERQVETQLQIGRAHV